MKNVSTLLVRETVSDINDGKSCNTRDWNFPNISMGEIKAVQTDK
jgi:hypothetical protein